MADLRSTITYKSRLYKSITEGKKLIEEEMKVGPKGQVVIPRTMRKALKIEPGSKVVFTLEANKLILKKPDFDAVAVFERIAKKIHSNGEINPHAYEEELEERNKS
jgi:AbrB family looped-hinge helix DNA binding protein